MSPTTIGALMAAVWIGGETIKGLIGVIKTLITKPKNGDGKKPDNTQVMLEKDFLRMMDTKADKGICAERHKHIDEGFAEIKKQLSNGADKMGEMSGDIKSLLAIVGKSGR